MLVMLVIVTLADTLLLFSCIVLAGVALVALEQRDAARREADRNARLARIGASVQGLGHDLNNLFTALPYVVEEMMTLEHPDRRQEAQREMEHTIEAASRLLQELESCARGTSAPGGGSLEGVVRFAVAGSKYRGARISMRIEADLRYEPEDFETIDRVRGLIAEAVEEAAALDRAVVEVELNDERLLIQYRAPAATVGTAEPRWKGWSLRRRVSEQGDGTFEVRLEISPSARG